MSVHEYLKNIGHSYFPAAIGPYRRLCHIVKKTSDLITGISNIPNEILDAFQIRKNGKYFRMDYPMNLTCDYNNADISTSVSGIIFMVDGKLHHGGLSDRLRGILTTYEFAKRHNLPFYIHWTYPFTLTDYLIPNDKINWEINNSEISYSANEAYPVVIMQTIELQTRFMNWLRLRMALHDHKKQIHVYSNADNARNSFYKLYHELFKPSPMLQSQIDFHLSNLGDKFYSFTFRFLNLLGDFKEHLQLTLSQEESDALIEKVCNEFIKMATSVPDGYRILITSDSGRFLKVAKNLDNRIYIVPGMVQNIDLVKKVNLSAWMKTFVDQQLIMRAEKVYLLRTGSMFKSGFPKFAANIGRRPFIDHKF